MPKSDNDTNVCSILKRPKDGSIVKYQGAFNVLNITTYGGMC